ncbi:hypothetical protein CI238_11149 [Colletotrichum incanum]|uniref:DUF7580 domain-containing protein n=1 Tax=Colletotrichum incanum TaxID=1573173 RepID=A0A161WAG9_COLIC|nr:hypothetical protein CI238_11149 [Colletotrichum incanum]
MSGFEIAGVVLGAFPILCDTAKDLGTVFKKTKSWWQFETSFENFVSTIATQEIAYIQVLERLLDPLDITDGDYESLLRDPRSSLWHEHHIQEELRQCLPQNNELYRLQTSFSDEKDRLLKRITEINDDLHQFFDRGSTVTRPSASKPSIPFRDLHHQAITFYECLARCWKCCCSTAHTVGITTYPGIQKPSQVAKNGCFNILFESEANYKQLRLQVQTFAASKCKSALDSALPAPTVKVEAAIELKSQMLVKKQLKSAANAASENSVSALAFTSLSISGRGCKTPRKSILKSAANKLKKFQHRKSVDSTPIEPERKSSINPDSTSSLSMTCVSNSTATIANDSGLKVPTERNGILRSQSSVSSIAKVRFAEAEPQSSLAEEDENRKREVVNLCDFVTSSATPNGDKDNMLSLDEGRRVILKPEPLDQSTIKASTTQSIDSFLKTTTVRQHRLYIGLSFALTLLCLATSSWIPTQPSKDDVFMVCCESGGKTQKRFGPYFSRTSRDICSPPACVDSRVWNAKSSLLLLGILLLELFHGQTLEQQDSWAESLDEGGQPNESTRICGAFLWICRAEESLKTYFGKELGGALYEAIRKCICFDFGRDDDYGDLRLAEVVYREVVVPLEKCCPPM